MTTVHDTPERGRWLKWIDRFSIMLALLGGLAAVAMMVNIVLDVIGRTFLNQPLPGTLDVTQFAYMPSLVALSLGYATLRGEHIRVGLLTASSGERTQRIIEIVSMGLTFVTVVLFIWFGSEKAEEMMSFGERSVGAPWLAVWPYRWVLALGLVGLLLQTMATLIRAITVKTFIADDADEELSVLENEGSVFDDLDPDLKDAHTCGREMGEKS